MEWGKEIFWPVVHFFLEKIKTRHRPFNKGHAEQLGLENTLSIHHRQLSFVW